MCGLERLLSLPRVYVPWPGSCAVCNKCAGGLGEGKSRAGGGRRGACVCAGRPWVGVSVIRDTDDIRTENYYIGSVTDMH